MSRERSESAGGFTERVGHVIARGNKLRRAVTGPKPPVGLPPPSGLRAERPDGTVYTKPSKAARRAARRRQNSASKRSRKAGRR